VVVEHIDRQDKEHKGTGIAGHFCGEPGYSGVANYKDEQNMVGNNESFRGKECAWAFVAGGEAVEVEDPVDNVEDYDEEEQSGDSDSESRQEDRHGDAERL